MSIDVLSIMLYTSGPDWFREPQDLEMVDTTTMFVAQHRTVALLEAC